MSTPGRKRKFDPTIPAHIDQRSIPCGVYWDRTGNGRWYVLTVVDGKRKAKTVATAAAKLSELQAILEQQAGVNRASLNWLLERFIESDVFRKKLADRTRLDYQKYRATVATLPTKAGKPLGELIVARLSLPFMQRLFDGVASKHPTKANHLLRYLRRVFAWGMTRGHCSANPCAGAEQAVERKARVVPDLAKMREVAEFARQGAGIQSRTPGSHAPYLWIVIEIAYECRLRPVEVITLTDAHADAEGVRTNRRKGSDDNLTRWGPRLRNAWDAAVEIRTAATKGKPVQLRPEDRTLIVAEDGSPLKRSSLDSAWQRLMRGAVKAGVIADNERFGLHAMKHRGITDTPGTRHEKRQASGHKSDAMMSVYDHSLHRVDPTSTD